MRLQPKRPPGRADRKAGVYAAEIVQLRTEGYTYEAIREALAEVGIQVSECALRREVRRHEERAARAAPVALALSPPASPPPSPAPPASAQQSLSRPPAVVALPPKTATGREIAEAFFNANPSNPLLAGKETS